MQAAGGYFCRQKCARCGDINVHFGWRFCRGHHLKFEIHPVNFAHFTGFANIDGWRNERNVTAANAFTDAAAHLTLRSWCQVGAKLECRPPSHRRTGHHIFGRCFSQKMFRRDNGDFAGLNIGFIDDAAYPAKMVAMAMAIDNCGYRTRTQLFIHKLQRRSGGITAGQRIDDNPTRLPFDDGHVGHIKPAHLPHIVGHRI